MKRSVAYRYLLWKMGLTKERDPEARDRVYAECLARLVEESELDRCVLLAYDEVYSQRGDRDERSFLYVSNDYVREVATGHPEQFLYGASVHPYRLDALEELSRVKEDGAVLVKLLPNSQGFDPSHEPLVPYWRRMAELDLALVIHCGFEHTISPIDQSYGDPKLLANALDQGVKVIIAHGGSSGRFHMTETFGDTLRLLADYPNCYFDNSAMTNLWRSKYLLSMLDPTRLSDKYGVELEDPFSKCLHGSDYPIPVTSWAFFGKLSGKQRRLAKSTGNPLQQDVELKRMLGVPDACLERAGELLDLPNDR